MKIQQVLYDELSFGITVKSLAMLRQALCRGYLDRLLVVQVPTNDLCCGFMVFDCDLELLTWTGDGFRTDESGEGGAGYRSAMTLLSLMGLVLRSSYLPLSDISILSHEERIHVLENYGKCRLMEYSLIDFAVPADRTPRYAH
jgi:hypothetical protein